MKKSKVLLKAAASLLSLLLFCSAAVPAGATEIPDNIQTYYKYDPQTGTYVFKTGEEFYGEAKSVPASDNLLEEEPELPIFGEAAGEDFSIPESDLPDGTEESFTNGTDEGEDDGMEPILISATAGQHGYYEYDPETGTDIFKTGEEFNGVAEPVPASGNLSEGDSSFPEVFGGIIGSEDNRKPVTNPTGVKTSTCLLGARFENGPYKGTGWLINNKYVATVGHLLYMEPYGYAEHIAVYVGASGGTSKQYRLGHYKVVGGDYRNHPVTKDDFVGVFDNDDYYNYGMFDDWGIIALDKAVTVDVTYLGRYTVNSYNDMKNRRYYSQGFPADKNADVEKWDDRVMYETEGSILGDQPRYLNAVKTDLDITPGQSGSPVYSYRSGYGYTAEAIAVGGKGDYNMLVLINNWLANYINTNLT